MEKSERPAAPERKTLERAANLLKRVAGEAVEPIPTISAADSSKAPESEKVVPTVVDSKPAEQDYDFGSEAEEKTVSPIAAAVEKSQEDFTPDDPTEEVQDPKELKDNVNWKKMRTSYKELNRTYKKTQEEKDAIAKKLKEYEDGVAVPEVMQSLTNRVAGLEVYEKLYNFKGSPVYQENFAKPIQQNKEKLVALAKENGLNEQVVDAVLNAQGADVDRVLTQYFKNPITALEAKGFVKNIQVKHAEALEAEKEPAKSLARMQQESDEIVASKIQKAHEVILHTSKEGWSESLSGLREDKRFAEISFREGDTEHNEKYVRPILTKAATEYGRTVKILAEHGMTQLPKELAVKLARSDQLAHYAAVLLTERDAANKRIQELEGQIKTRNFVSRPGITGTSHTAAPAPTGRHGVGAMEAGRRVLSRVQNNG